MTAIEHNRRSRWEAFYATGPADRSKEGTTPSDESPRHLLLVDTPSLDPARPPLHPDRKQDRIEWAWAKYLAQLERMEWLADDRIPYLDCLTGTEIFAQAFGCEVGYPELDNPFAIPCVHNANEASALAVPSLDSPSLALMFEIAEELRRRAGDEALLRLPDIQSPMDIAGIVWDKNDFFISIVESQDAVLDLAQKTGNLLTRFLDEWFARYGHAFVAHYPDYYMPFGITLSEDEIGSVGPELFEKLFLPELSELSRRYDAIGIHCCAHAVHQWDGLARVEGLRVLNLNQPDEVIREAIPRFAGVAAQLPLASPVTEPDQKKSALEWEAAWRDAFERAGSARLIYNVTASDEDAARAMVDGFRAALGGVAPSGNSGTQR
ncbi:MAG: uroporphyrinogen decarboxylase family protein [Pseudomonadales bacterium]|jgi:hypothetical protein|nr:uroporphyrinogen decarboxylase family protein [Pseudomonadales bacterium]